MKYLICQDWINTSGNHSGMKHMCLLLKEKYPEDYSVVIFPDLINKYFGIKTFWGNIYAKILNRAIVSFKYKKIAAQLSRKLKENDSIYLLEYCEDLYSQLHVAKQLRSKFQTKNIKISGLIHLVPQNLSNKFTNDELKIWIEPLDEVLTLGTSLSEHLISKIGIPENKVRTLFHYADLDYYNPLPDFEKHLNKKETPKVLVMGNMKRNFDILKKIVADCPHIQFIICQGMLDLRENFKDNPNVTLKGFLLEKDLLDLMRNCDISLNVMDDMIGSNVITTSMAVGMAILASDVGSIRDYCKQDGAIYCANEDYKTFSNAINELLNNKERLISLRMKSLTYSKEYAIENLNKLL